MITYKTRTGAADLNKFRDLALTDFLETGKHNDMVNIGFDPWQFKSEDIITVLAYHDENLVGFSWLHLVKDIATFNGSYVLPDYRKEGIGSKFYEIRKGLLTTIPGVELAMTYIDYHNEASCRTAEKNGFKHVATIPKFGRNFDGTRSDTKVYQLDLLK